MSAPAIVPVCGRLLSLRAAATYLGVSERRMRRLIAKTEVAVMRSARGRVLGLYQADLDDWRDRRRQPARTERAGMAPVDDRMRALLPPVRRFAGR